MEIKDKIVIVTGASSGIGAALSRLLAAGGAKVALIARSDAKIQALAKELPGSWALSADMSKEDEVREMVKKVADHFGRVDILVNNAGQGYSASLEETDTTKFRYLLELNVIGQLVAMQAVIPLMRAQGNGLIINVSSGTSLMYLPGMAAYSATKRALNGLALTVRAELAKDNIKVSVIHPYMTETDFYQNMLKFDGQPEKAAADGTPRLDMSKADSAEFVAQEIIKLIGSEEAERVVHDWMKKL